MAVSGRLRDAGAGRAGRPPGAIAATAGLERLVDLNRDQAGLGAGRVGQGDRKFLAAQPRHEIAGADAILCGGGEGLDDGVADRVAEAVVDLLEAVEVEHDRRDRGCRSVRSRAIAALPHSKKARRLARPVSELVSAAARSRISTRSLVSDTMRKAITWMKMAASSVATPNQAVASKETMPFCAVDDDEGNAQEDDRALDGEDDRERDAAEKAVLHPELHGRRRGSRPRRGRSHR